MASWDPDNTRWNDAEAEADRLGDPEWVRGSYVDDEPEVQPASGLASIICPSAAKVIERELYFLGRLAEDAEVRIPQLAGDITYLDTQVFCRQWYRDEQRLESLEDVAWFGS